MLRRQKAGRGLLRNIDFAENFDIGEARQAQSEQHWSKKSVCPLYASVEVFEWNPDAGELVKWVEVTVGGERADEERPLDAIWASTYLNRD